MSHVDEFTAIAEGPLPGTDVKRLACLVNSAEEIDEDAKSKKSFKDLTVRKILHGAALAGQAVRHKGQVHVDPPEGST